MPLRPESEAKARAIIETEANETDYRRSYTETLTRIFLTEIAPWRQRMSDFELSVRQFMSCPKCVAEVWEYFKNRLKCW